jgi:hypothetical protein
VSERTKLAIDALVSRCCSELFAAYHLDVQPVVRELQTKGLPLWAIIGFGGKQMRGALVLASTHEPLDLTCPGKHCSPRDWICELSNQLMGRVKNRLLGWGVEVHLATPAGLSGEQLAVSSRGAISPQTFVADAGLVSVWIDLELSLGFELPRSPPDANAALMEGSTLLF